MNFDFTSELEAVAQAAREVAQTVLQPIAADIDATGRIPEAARAATASFAAAERNALERAVAVEELATVSGAAAAVVALGQTPGGSAAGTLAGLRGIGRVETPTDQQYLGLAAVCVGLGRGALEQALEVVRGRGDRPSGDAADPPHWALADAATELQGARLLVHAAAQGGAPGAAGAAVFAFHAAQRAVEAATRVVGPAAFVPGSPLERCGRDVRAAQLLAGTEDDARRRSADALLR